MIQKFINRNYTKLNEADLLHKEILIKEGQYIRTLEDELNKHQILNELNNKFNVYDNKIPLSNEEASLALEDLPSHSHIMKLPKSLVNESQKSYQSILKNGVPNKSEVKYNATSLTNSLKRLTEVLEYERFEDVSIEDLNKRISLQNWTNYFNSFKNYFCPNYVQTRDIITPTEETSEKFLKLAQMYQKMSKDEKADLHELGGIQSENSTKVFESLESYLHSNDYLQIYTVLKNNSKFLDYIEGAEEQLQTIEDYLLYQTLTEINYLQNVKKVT